jgi:cytochrome P450
MLMRYDDISAVLHDDARFTARVGEGQPTSMLTSDPPQHTRLRSLVNKGFTARRVQSLRPRIEAIVDGLLDGLESSRDIDLIADFAYPLPISVIAELLGVDPEHRDFFRKVGEQVAFSLGPAAEGMAYQRPANDRADIFKYFEELIERRRTDPKDDLASALVHAEDQGDLLSHVELLAMLFLLLVGGHETTVNLVTNGVLSLLRHPEEMERFRALADVPDADERFSLQRRALEEVLRYDSPVQYTGRIATTDLEIGGTQIHKGDRVRLILASANRDDTVFPDAERFDIAREPNAHLAFGIGRHFCLGSQLARLSPPSSAGFRGSRSPSDASDGVRPPSSAVSRSSRFPSHNERRAMTVHYQADDAIPVVTRPPGGRQPVDHDTAMELVAGFDRFEAADALHVAILMGAGKNFCGGDLKPILDRHGVRSRRISGWVNSMMEAA